MKMKISTVMQKLTSIPTDEIPAEVAAYINRRWRCDAPAEQLAAEYVYSVVKQEGCPLYGYKFRLPFKELAKSGAKFDTAKAFEILKKDCPEFIS